MIAIISNGLVFLSFMSAFIVHLRNRQSHSYLIMGAYFLALVVMVHRISQIHGCVSYGFWTVPLVMLGLGEVFRFTGVEKQIACKVDSLRRKKGLHYCFNYFKHNYSVGEKSSTYYFHDGVEILKTYESELSCTVILKAERQVIFELTPEDFDTHVKYNSKTVIVEPENKSNYYTAMTPMQIHMAEGSTIELNIRKR